MARFNPNQYLVKIPINFASRVDAHPKGTPQQEGLCPRNAARTIHIMRLEEDPLPLRESRSFSN